MHDQVKRPYNYRLYDDYNVLQPSFEVKKSTSKLLQETDCLSTSVSFEERAKSVPPKGIQSKHILEGLTQHFIQSITKYE